MPEIFYRSIVDWEGVGLADAKSHTEKVPKSAKEIQGEFGIQLEISQGERGEVIVRAQPTKNIVQAHVVKNDEVGSIVMRADLQNTAPEGIVELTAQHDEHVTLQPFGVQFYESIDIYPAQAVE